MLREVDTASVILLGEGGCIMACLEGDCDIHGVVFKVAVALRLSGVDIVRSSTWCIANLELSIMRLVASFSAMLTGWRFCALTLE